METILKASDWLPGPNAKWRKRSHDDETPVYHHKRDWSKALSGDFTQEDVEAGRVEGVVYDPNMREGITAHRYEGLGRNDVITVGPTFFRDRHDHRERSPWEKALTITHELGHDAAAALNAHWYTRTKEALRPWAKPGVDVWVQIDDYPSDTVEWLANRASDILMGDYSEEHPSHVQPYFEDDDEYSRNYQRLYLLVREALDAIGLTGGWRPRGETVKKYDVEALKAFIRAQVRSGLDSISKVHVRSYVRRGRDGSIEPVRAHERGGRPAKFTPPQKTVKGYKLFRLKDGKLYPLFIGKRESVPIGEWIEAEEIPTKGYAVRPGWHAGHLPIAPHLRSRDGRIASDRVWAEVEMPDDIDWQSVANQTKTKDIRFSVPRSGHYRWKTSRLQGGSWLIGGAMKVNRVLSNDEVREILVAAGLGEEAEAELGPAADLWQRTYEIKKYRVRSYTRRGKYGPIFVSEHERRGEEGESLGDTENVSTTTATKKPRKIPAEQAPKSIREEVDALVEHRQQLSRIKDSNLREALERSTISIGRFPSLKRAYNRAMSRIRKKMPGFDEAPPIFVVDDLYIDENIPARTRGYGAVSVRGLSNLEIEVNKLYARDLAKARRMFKKANDECMKLKGFRWLNAKSLEDVLVHELGHVVFSATGHMPDGKYSPGKQWTKLWRDRVGTQSEQDLDAFGRIWGGYSFKSPAEWFAEAFLLWVNDACPDPEVAAYMERECKAALLKKAILKFLTERGKGYAESQHTVLGVCAQQWRWDLRRVP